MLLQHGAYALVVAVVLVIPYHYGTLKAVSEVGNRLVLVIGVVLQVNDILVVVVDLCLNALVKNRRLH